MTDQRHNAPRRYFVDARGHRVLIGLSPEETAEFEALDLASNETGQFTSEVRARKGAVADGEIRWHELYSKHAGAWRAWIAQSQTARAPDSGFVNYV
ncbi:hypothetical protein ACM43_05000 [Bradyrhizobium sp. CCBAU 45321]|uniref:hypothetical protein n=1 Tax=Bradyrhizobium sp. CCBAU 45321 TaxID=1641878 RepID=UPI0023027DCB|nr:hypothetical protein [Bradyrhizobium sp. CCBAU 45321]MDA9543920.1 hypothetical protein [Bradyrhizobium sp. CCBAU 45321]